MAHAFPPIYAKPTFGTLRENLYQSDYIKRKKGKITVCNSPSYCNRITNSDSYEKRNSYNLGIYARSLENCNVIPVNKGNLIMGQYTKLDLKHVCTVIPTTPCTDINTCGNCDNGNPVKIDQSSSTPFYYDNTIDPAGELFGSSQCGELNYTHYMVFYPPASPLTLGSS